MLWENLKSDEFPEAVKKSKGVCVIPIGAMERHGPHMAVGMDNIVVEEVARRAAEIEPVVVFPTFHFGEGSGLQYLDGSICLSNRLILDYLFELCKEIARSGFKKILFLNGHGGNPPLLNTLCSMCRELKKDYVVVWAESYMTAPLQLRDAVRADRDAFPYLTQEDIRILEGYFNVPREAGHADFEETLALLGVRPETVDVSLMDREDGESNHRMDHLRKRGIFGGGQWLANHPYSYQSSYYPGANERLGKAMIQVRVADIVDIFRVIKEDEELLKYNDEWNRSW